ncbi:putative CRM1-nuclear export factor, exportin [Piptocephalis cylindrospora]|uniref:Putative CRM1-nuclear export factor, exportin n=1 Tax=Piptocephalis cylindrospora TaxID=1907219 RepID=A0A4P9Y4Z1_9FUNG|nr:putative CRM1-nuclear export factor, exportin [Piptocephalis cylindrospora]|eukprot:RKP13231.1 putative CRM1-nuclear export factor, exportin [Piptocephalis cylindrospora]
MEEILDFTRPLDVGLLDRVVSAFFTGHGAEQQRAQQVLTQFQEHPDAWKRADTILENSKVLQSRFIALQILEKLIQTRWKAMPSDTTTGIKNYVVSTVIKYSSDEETLHRERTFVNKLNMILVQVLKQEWPHNWPNFIPEIVSVSRTNVALCENNMVVLKLLSEEIFDFSAEQMTQEKAKNLKMRMCHEFAEIFQLCLEVLSKAEKPSLVRATLETLLRFLNWIPLGYVFETDIIDTLRERFLDIPAFRNLALKCLTEIGGLVADAEYDEKFVLLFEVVTSHIARLVPISTDIEQVYANSSDRDQEFIQNLALFFTNILQYHLRAIEKHPNKDNLMLAHQYLIKISRVEEREVFKVCLEYWNKVVSELYLELKSTSSHQDMTERMALGAAMGSREAVASPGTAASRRDMYSPILQALRVVMIERMVKPEEVLVVENDEGEIVRESLKESDTIVLYKSQREVLVYLTHLDAYDTEKIMTEKLGRQMDGSEWSWVNLNKLCWAIGSISGAMTEESEKRFLVTVIKDLLGLCEQKRGKDNKAVVASNIMYVVGQYPRFLKAHWRFLKTVVNKLFEFMHELHEGVQDMACDTFIKISQKCRRHFVMQQIGEQRPFVEEIIDQIPTITADLQPLQIHTFYEALGYMINSQSNRSIQAKLVARCMSGPNEAWERLIGALGTGDLTLLDDLGNVKALVNILKTNVSSCLSIGPGFYPQLGKIFMDVLALYRTVSERISTAVEVQGTIATKTPLVRQMRTVKKDTLKLILTYIQSLQGTGFTGYADMDKVMETMMAPLLQTVLTDYSRNVEAARESEVLSATAGIIQVLGDRMTPSVPAILDNVFECTLSMISRDFSEYPEHRVGFFSLLRAINARCFAAVLALPPDQFKLMYDSVVWAFKHAYRDIMDTGLLICEDLLDNIANEGGDVASGFYQRYFLALLQDVFAVLTDNEHKAGFKGQCDILARLFGLVAEGQVVAPLDPSVQSVEGNAPFLKEHVVHILLTAYKQNVQASRVNQFVEGLFTLHGNREQFKLHVRDFLIDLKEQIGDTSDLFVDEREAESQRKEQQERDKALAVPGLVKPSDLPDMED